MRSDPIVLPPIGHKDRSSQINGSVASHAARPTSHPHPAAHVRGSPAGQPAFGAPSSGARGKPPAHRDCVLESVPGHALPRSSVGLRQLSPIVMRGSLDGCWYEHIETARTRRRCLPRERHGALCRPARWRPRRYVHHDLQVRGETERRRRRGTRPLPHPIVSGSGTGGRRRHRPFDFKDIIGDPITFVYRGHISLR